MKNVLVTAALALTLLLAGCSRLWFGLGKKPANATPAAAAASGREEPSGDGLRVVAPATLDELAAGRKPLEGKKRQESARSALEGAVPSSVAGNVGAPVHQRYLDEPMVFSALPPNPFPGQKTAVAAADGLQLLDDSIGPLAGDRQNILALVGSGAFAPLAEIPVGTVLPLLGVYQDRGGREGEKDWFDGLFRYRNDLNWFYLTEYKGTRGMVWGAGLRGATLRRPKTSSWLGPFEDEIHTLDSAEVMRLSYYYSKPRRGAAWIPFIGARAIDPAIAKSLEQGRVAFEQTVYGRGSDYSLFIDHPDDLLALYLLQKENPAAGSHSSRRATDPDTPLYDKNRGIPTFLTTDLVAHCLHLLFDRMLAQVEEESLLPGLAKLVGRLQERARALPGMPDPAAAPSVALVGSYLSVAEALLRLAPVVPPGDQEDEWDANEPPDAAVDRQALLAQYGGAARQELDLILAAGGVALSPVMRIEIDYSQFKPRGHYTRSETLAAYFRAMQWLGQAQIDIDLRRTPPRDERLSEQDFTVLHGLAALILNRLLVDDREAFDLWRALSDPVGWLVGASDDIVPSDTVPLLAPILSRDPGSWAAAGKVVEVLAGIAPKLRKPRIQGSLLVGGTADGARVTQLTDQGEEELLPVTFRLFGPRFTLDSWFFSQLSGHRIPGKVPRNMVRGLDVIALLGSSSARSLLRDEQAANPGYAAAFERVEAQVSALGPAAFQESFYAGCLDLVARLAAFESGSGFYFTETPRWDTKALVTSHAAWAELRHDTLLYTKQSAAEKAGNGGWEPTFSTRDYPLQVHAIEPNLPFFYSLRGLLDRLESRARQFLPHEYALKLADFAALVDAMTGIVEKETLDRPLTDEENVFILDVPAYLARIVIPAGAGEWVRDPDQLKMAVVADVHTDFMDNAVLEVATGMPYRIYVALNDGQGGKRVAVGYTYSYYEFTRPLDGRLTDEEWKALVYPSSEWDAPPTARSEVAERLRPYQPGWLRGKAP